MSWLGSLDAALFRFINLKLSNPFFDWLMPQLSSNAWFIPVVLVAVVLFFWKGGLRGRLFVLTMVIVLSLGDTLLINAVKKTVARPRPHAAVPEARLLVGAGGSASMPSSHTSTWFAATVIAYAYYRRSWRFMLPFAVLMAFSRVYLGAHYPSDVLAGAILGGGFAAFGLWGLTSLWCFAGRRWFPWWWNRLPTLVPDATGRMPVREEATQTAPRTLEQQGQQWLWASYLLIAGLLVVRLFYLASGRIELSEDEAYQWLWSKHLALSYYSKPPMIAWLQFLGTSLWGDTALGVRFCAPVIAAALCFILVRFFAQELNARVAFLVLLTANTMPLLAAGSILMTIDPPLVLFWTAAMLAGWRALQTGGTLRAWLWVGLWSGLAFLSKYSAIFLLPSFALFFLLWPPARAQLRRPGPYVALLLAAMATLPVLIWNAEHGWITVRHVSENAKLDHPWRPTLRFFADFLLAEGGLMNPIFFAAILIALVRFWGRSRQRPLSLYFFAMGAPVFFGYWLYTFHSRVQPNWIAPAVIPLLCLAVVYWEERWREGLRAVRPWFLAGLTFGATAVVTFHETDLIHRITRVWLPPQFDPLRRVRAISQLAEVIGQARLDLAKEGKETFIVAAHYGLTGQLTFYLPEARAGLPNRPLVFVRTSATPKNQFFFWPEYRYRNFRRGQNAIFATFNDTPRKPPAELVDEFESITDLGICEVQRGSRVFHRVQLYACRNLR